MGSKFNINEKVKADWLGVFYDAEIIGFMMRTRKNTFVYRVKLSTDEIHLLSAKELRKKVGD